MKFDIEYYSNIGKRSENQDSLLFDISNGELIACIADGVGGKLGGRQASNFSVNVFIENYKSQNSNPLKLPEIVLNIHKGIILEAQKEKYFGMATTFTGIILNGSKLYGIHTGDTRACILRGNGIKQLTHDHTEVARLVKEGRISFEESITYPRRNIIESALGIEDVEPLLQNYNFNIIKGDRIILTTDGVHETISKRDFRDISLKSNSSKQFLDTLIEYLLRKEPNDNNSIIVITII